MKILALLFLSVVLISCSDEKQPSGSEPEPETIHLVKCWDRYFGNPVGEVACDTVDLRGDSVLSAIAGEGIRNHTMLALRFEHLIGMDTGSTVFPTFVQDSTFCLMRRSTATMQWNGTSTPVVHYELQGCRDSSVALLGDLVFAQGYGLIINMPELTLPVILTRIEKNGTPTDTKELIAAVFADTTFLPPQHSAEVPEGGN